MTISPSEDDDGHEIGYGKPPKHTQFPKGRSGNPKGRPKKLKRVKELFAEALAKKVEIKGKMMTKQELIVEALIQHAAKGKTTALNIVFGQMAAIESDGQDEFDPLYADEIALGRWIKNLTNQNPEANDL